MGISGGGEEEELSLAPPEDVPAVPPPGMGVEGVPAPPAAQEDEFGIEPLEEEAPRPTYQKGAPKPPAAPAGEEEVASLSDFEISGEVEEEGEELGAEEAELLSVQGPAFRQVEEPQGASVLMTVVLAASAIVIAFAAVLFVSFALGGDVAGLAKSLGK